MCSGTRTNKELRDSCQSTSQASPHPFSHLFPIHSSIPHPGGGDVSSLLQKEPTQTSPMCKGGSHERAASGHANPAQLRRGVGRSSPTQLHTSAVHNHRREISATTLAHTRGGRVRQSTRRSVERGSSALSQGRIEVSSPYISEASQAEGARLKRRFRVRTHGLLCAYDDCHPGALGRGHPRATMPREMTMWMSP